MPLTLTAESTEFVGLDEVRSHLNVTDRASDVELDMIRGAAQDAVEGIVGPVLWRTVTEQATASTAGVTLLRHAPVVSVSLPVSAVVLNAEGGMLTLPAYTYSSPVAVTYVAGRAVVPDSIRLATLIIAAHLWRTQQGSTPTQFGDDEAVTPIGFALPNRALELLRPYALGPAIA